MKKLSFAAAALALFALGGCGEASQIAAPADVEPLFSRQGAGGVLYAHRAPGTPPFKSEIVTLEVQAGHAGEVTLTFADGSPFARFSVTEESMRGATLNGEDVGDDETVTVTIRRVDASRFLLDMQPSGLVFNPESPASIEFYYENAILPRGSAGVFKQEKFGDVWTEVDSNVATSVITGEVEDFTLYAMAAPH